MLHEVGPSLVSWFVKNIVDHSIVEYEYGANYQCYIWTFLVQMDLGKLIWTSLFHDQDQPLFLQMDYSGSVCGIQTWFLFETPILIISLMQCLYQYWLLVEHRRTLSGDDSDFIKGLIPTIHASFQLYFEACPHGTIQLPNDNVYVVLSKFEIDFEKYGNYKNYRNVFKQGLQQIPKKISERFFIF